MSAQVDQCLGCAATVSPTWRFCRSCGALTASAPIDETALWYVAARTGRMGPLGMPQLRRLAADGQLRPVVPVWRAGMAEWLPARDTELGALLGHVTRASVSPPPLPGVAIDNRLVWWLVAAPLLGVIGQYALAPDNPRSLWWITIILNLVLSYFDGKRLEQAGHKVEGASTFFIPVYLFKRATTVGQEPYYAWAWLAVFVVSLGL
jgi:hypothetical protein